MRLKDLANQFNTTNKELISFYKNNGYSISSHMANLSDEMVELVNKSFQPSITKEEVKNEKKENIVEKRQIKKFDPNDRIPCKSVTPWILETVGVDKNTVYHWEYFGDIDYIKYSDLEHFRRSSLVTSPNIIILDDDICYQWRRELGNVYDYFLAIEYPEDFFEKDDDEFLKIISEAPDNIKEIIKITALNMVRNENYPSLKKIKMIDDTFGTCIKDFI